MKPLLRLLALGAFLFLSSLVACDSVPPDFGKGPIEVTTDRTYLRDSEGRFIHLHAVNVGGSTKVPLALPAAKANGREFTYVGRPFAQNEARHYFHELRRLGFNGVRLLFIWEAVFPDNRDTPDVEFLDYFESLLAAARDEDVYVLINMHENLWSRHIFANVNENAQGTRGDFEKMAYGLLPPYDNKVVGDGAPMWATRACLPEKNWPSDPWGYPPHWGTHPLVGGLAKDEDGIKGSDLLFLVSTAAPFLGLYDKDDPVAKKNFKDTIEAIDKKLPTPFHRNDTNDLIPLSGWWNNMIVSLDVERCYAAFFAGDKVFPDLKVDSDGVTRHIADLKEPAKAMDLKEYLQGSFVRAWAEITRRAAKVDATGRRLYPNVIGYDLMNEPAATFYLATVVAAWFAYGMENEDTVKNLLNTLLPKNFEDLVKGIDITFPNEPKDTCAASCANTCGVKCDTVCKTQADCDTLCTGDASCLALCKDQITLCQATNSNCAALCASQVEACVKVCEAPDKDKVGTKLWYLLKFIELLPPDTSDETKKSWGFDGVDLFGLLGVNDAFDVFQLQPVFERAGNVIKCEACLPDEKGCKLAAQTEAEQITKEGLGDDQNPCKRALGDCNDWEAARDCQPMTDLSKVTIWLEPTGSGGLQGETYMTKPLGLKDVVYSPHYYPDIYPFLGINQPERDFSTDEVRFREGDYQSAISASAQSSARSLSNIPIVFGEFGTYWNYKYKNENWEELGIIQSRRNDYRVSSEILDNYYEAYEALFLSNILWTFTTDNDPRYGDAWNHEDFSIVTPKLLDVRCDQSAPSTPCCTPGSGTACCDLATLINCFELDEQGKTKKSLDGRPVFRSAKDADGRTILDTRGELAWSRPYARALSGKPVSMHFYSDFHYFDSDANTVDPRREFEVVYIGHQSSAPTEVFVPAAQYPEGFYVWLSDGTANWDGAARVLRVLNSNDDPQAKHTITIRPPLEGQARGGWNYFVSGNSCAAARGN